MVFDSTITNFKVPFEDDSLHALKPSQRASFYGNSANIQVILWALVC